MKHALLIILAAAAAAPPLGARALSCTGGTFAWSGYCWHKRDSSGEAQGPGNNYFVPSLVAVLPSGSLQLRVAKAAVPGLSGKRWASSEVWLEESLGLGDYVIVVETLADAVDPSVTFAPFFIYKNDNNEIDIEWSKWGDPGDPTNAQYVLQPYTLDGALQRYTMPGGAAGKFSTHRVRWEGTSTPGQVKFESWTAAGKLVATWAARNGTNFVPGDKLGEEGERVHINHWINGNGHPSSGRAQVGRVACFRFCPINATAGPAGCGAWGVKPTCTNGKRSW